MSERPKLNVVKRKGEARQVLEELLRMADNIDGLIVVAVDGFGRDIIKSTSMNLADKMYFVQFMNAWAATKFDIPKMQVPGEEQLS